MGYLIAVLVGFIGGAVFGILVGDDNGYVSGCQETHDYYHTKGVRK